MLYFDFTDFRALIWDQEVEGSNPFAPTAFSIVSAQFQIIDPKCCRWFLPFSKAVPCSPDPQGESFSVRTGESVPYARNSGLFRFRLAIRAAKFGPTPTTHFEQW